MPSLPVLPLFLPFILLKSEPRASWRTTPHNAVRKATGSRRVQGNIRIRSIRNLIAAATDIRQK